MDNISKGQVLEFSNYLSLKIFFIFAYSAEPDEMPHYVASHLGLHCLKYNHLPVSRINKLRIHFFASLL